MLVIETSQGGVEHRLCRQEAGTLLTRPGVVCGGSLLSGSRLMSSLACSQMSGWTVEDDFLELYLLGDCHVCALHCAAQGLPHQQHSRT